MGRIDSPAGRKMAALDAEKEAKRKAEEQRIAAIEAAKAAKAQALAEKEAAKAQALAEKEAAKQAAQQPVATASVEAAPVEPPTDESRLSKIKNKLLGMFGG